LRFVLASDASTRAAPMHRENVRNVVAKLKELDTALVEENALRDELFRRNLFAPHVVRPMGIGSFGALSEPNSKVSMYLMEAFKEGFIEFSELPKSLQDMVPLPPRAAPQVMKAAKAKLSDWTAAA
jgi:hypothetical protein